MTTTMTITTAHRIGICGGDLAGCERCVYIASLDLNYEDVRRRVLANRRNLALYRAQGTIGNLVILDPDDSEEPL